MRNFTVSWLGQEVKLTASTPMEAVKQATQSTPDLVIHSGAEYPPQHGCSIWKFSVTTPEEGWPVWVRERYSFEYVGEGE